MVTPHSQVIPPGPRIKPFEVVSRWGMASEHRRLAWAEYLMANKALVMERIAEKLEGADRRHFDSSDMFATVLRRVDWMADRLWWRPRTEEDLWRGLFEIVDGLVERRRLRALSVFNAERDPGLAACVADILSDDRDPTGVLLEMLERVPNARDRRILAMRMRGASYRMIAQALGLSEDTLARLMTRVYARARALED